MQVSLGELGEKMIKIKSDNEYLEKNKIELENNISNCKIQIEKLQCEVNSLESLSTAKISTLEEELNLKSETLKSNISQIEDLEQTLSK